MPPLLGIHHVTAIAGDPQRNLDFCAGTLGMRLIKVAVNFDDPLTYHLYYGDTAGTPGTLLTFFPWPHARRGTPGAGEVAETALAVPPGAIRFWEPRLRAAKVAVESPETRWGQRTLRLADPDGMVLRLVEDEAAPEALAYGAGPIPMESAICGMHSVTLRVADADETTEFLTETLGCSLTGDEDGRARFRMFDGPCALVEVMAAPELGPPALGAGSVHHVAWRTADAIQQGAWRLTVLAAGRPVTPVRERFYFKSIYFHEPGNVLFEIATDGPGFATDEALEALGSALRLPPWLEPQRAQIEPALPRLKLPKSA